MVSAAPLFRCKSQPPARHHLATAPLPQRHQSQGQHELPSANAKGHPCGGLFCARRAPRVPRTYPPLARSRPALAWAAVRPRGRVAWAAAVPHACNPTSSASAQSRPRHARVLNGPLLTAPPALGIAKPGAASRSVLVRFHITGFGGFLRLTDGGWIQ